MNIIAVDDERLSLIALESAIKIALPDKPLHCFGNADSAIEYARGERIDVAFLDIELGAGINGLTLAKELSAINPYTNIIFVTGYSEYYEEAFNQYASGYVKKPVLAKRIQKEISHLRYPIETRVLALGDFTFDYDAKRVYRNGTDVALSPREFLIFTLFAQNPQKVFKPEEIFSKVWGNDPLGSISTVKVHISSLRKKLDLNHNMQILYKKGEGYYLEVD